MKYPYKGPYPSVRQRLAYQRNLYSIHMIMIMGLFLVPSILLAVGGMSFLVQTMAGENTHPALIVVCWVGVAVIPHSLLRLNLHIMMDTWVGDAWLSYWESQIPPMASTTDVDPDEEITDDA